jgi:restriction endonuclease S subunit
MKLSEEKKKAGWQIVRFDEIARNISKRVEPSETDLEVYVGLEHLDPQSLRITRRGVPSDVGGQKLRVRPGQIIFGKRRAYQKKLAVADFDGICSAHAMVLKEIPGKIIPGLLPYFMQSDMFMDRAVAISEGSLSPTIKWKALAMQEFPLPPPDRQKAILEVLQEVEECICHGSEVEARLRKAIRVFLSHIFPTRGVSNAKQSTLIGLSQRMQTGPFGSQLHASDYVEAGVRVIMPKDLRRSTFIDYSGAAAIKEKKADGLKRHYLQDRDFLFARRGDIGLVGQYRLGDPPAICGTGCILFRPKANVRTAYLRALLGAPTSQKWLQDNAVGMTMPNLSTKIISSLPVEGILDESRMHEIADSYTEFSKLIEGVVESVESRKKLSSKIISRLLMDSAEA